MKTCILCKQEKPEAEIDFLGRCFPCFHEWVNTPEDQRPKIGKPFVPIYNGDR